MKLNRPAFYLLSCTWGAVTTAVGILIFFVLFLTGHKPKRWGYSYYFEVGKKPWGGASWGFVFLKDRSRGNSRLKNHEFGHALQNCAFGPFMLILVSLPSTLRYWARSIAASSGHPPRKSYDSIWFEGQATRLGTEKMRRLKGLDD